MKTKKHWEKIGRYPHHGILVHLSALRSQKSFGIGEYLDLIPVIDWCKKQGFDCLQILPINDSGFDPSPYNALSSIALDPIHLSLHELKIQNHPSSLSKTPRVLRKEVYQQKLTLFKDYFSEIFKDVEKTTAYQTILKENQNWLEPYALFKGLKEIHDHKHWKDWSKKENSLDPKILDFYRFLQFHAFRQMKKVRAYAEKQKILLIGDIPILLNPDSADVWANPKLFNLELSAGCPPDFYNPKGQNWGFPLFHLDNMRKEQFSWWKQRLQFAENFFDIYRIDHVIGLFRIWGIKQGQSPIDGTYYPKNPDTWIKNGSEILEMLLESSHLLPIAEDLGTISYGIKKTLKKFNIPGTRLILQMQTKKGDYIPFDQYEPDSMTTLSTHDSPTFELWWKSYPEEASHFAHFMKLEYNPILKKEEMLKVIKAAHQTASLFHINLFQEYLALFEELVWLNLEDERINRPGTILPTNWTYRYRPFLEEVLQHEDLHKAIQMILCKARP